MFLALCEGRKSWFKRKDYKKRMAWQHTVFYCYVIEPLNVKSEIWEVISGQ